jgi:hypothetical protein
MRRFFGLIVVAGLLSLSGCSGLGASADTAVMGGGTVAPLMALDGATVIMTDKTISDHLISIASGKNCSTVRTELGMHYCEEDEPKGEAAVYCYRTLGSISCFDRPQDGATLVEDRAAPIVRR